MAQKFKASVVFLRSLLFYLVIAEISSHIFIYLAFKKTTSEYRAEILQQHRRETDSLYLPHPTLGYVSSSPNSNNMGFFAQSDYPIKRDDNNFIIGMFGGSKADMMSGKFNSLQMAEVLKKNVPSLQNKNIVLLSFASGCAKQPMQFSRFSRFAEDLDLAINLDGANELLFSMRGADITTPCMTELLYYNNVFNSEYSPILNLFFFYATKVQDKMFESVLIEKSAFFVMLSKFSDLIQAKLASDLQTSVSKKIEKSEGSKLFPFSPKTDSRDLYSLGAQNWAKYAQLQFAVAREVNVPIIFALLPNILSQGSKSLTVEEKKHFEGNGKIWASKSENFSKGYQELKNYIAPLHNKHPNNFIDLTDLFKNETQMLYSDALGHFNDEGSRIAWVAIIKNLNSVLKNKNPLLSKKQNLVRQ